MKNCPILMKFGVLKQIPIKMAACISPKFKIFPIQKKTADVRHFHSSVLAGNQHRIDFLVKFCVMMKNNTDYGHATKIAIFEN